MVELCDGGVNFVTCSGCVGRGSIVESGGGIAMLTLKMLRLSKVEIVWKSGEWRDVEVEVLFQRRRGEGALGILCREAGRKSDVLAEGSLI